MLYVFFCQNTDTTMIYTLSLHDALPICDVVGEEPGQPEGEVAEVRPEEERLAARRRRERLDDVGQVVVFRGVRRSEEHTSELQSRENLVCRLLLEKKNIM